MAKAQRTAAFVSSGGGAWLRWLDESREYLVVGEQSLGRCAMARQTLAPGSSTIGCIRRACQTGFFVLEGEATASAGNRTLQLAAGTFLNVRPGTPWNLHNATTEPARLLTIAAPAGLDEFEFRTGLPLAGPDDLPAGLAPEERSIPAAVALDYGIHLDLCPSVFDAEPCLRVSLPGEGQARALGGGVYRPLARSHDTEGRYAAVHVRVGVGHVLPWHKHAREDLFIHMLSGVLSIDAGDQSTALEANGFAHLPASVPFRLSAGTDAVAELLLIAAPAGLENLIELAGVPWESPDRLPSNVPGDLEKLAAHAGDFGIAITS